MNQVVKSFPRVGNGMNYTSDFSPTYPKIGEAKNQPSNLFGKVMNQTPNVRSLPQNWGGQRLGSGSTYRSQWSKGYTPFIGANCPKGTLHL